MCGAELYEINVKKSKEADHDYFCDITFYAFVFNLETITFDETDKSYFGGFYEKDGSMYLTYYTWFKEPFEHLLIGYLQTVAEKTYNVGVNITLLKSTDGKFGVNTHHAALGIKGEWPSWNNIWYLGQAKLIHRLLPGMFENHMWAEVVFKFHNYTL